MRGESATTIEDRVVQAVAEALGVPPHAVVAAPTLFDLPGFDSVTVVAILSRLEDELGTEIPPDAIVPEAFESLGALTRLFQVSTAFQADTAFQANGGQA